MSLDKAIVYGKEHRKPYTKTKAIDPSCRNHKGCPWCEGNRLYKTKKEEEKMEYGRREETSDRTVMVGKRKGA